MKIREKFESKLMNFIYSTKNLQKFEEILYTGYMKNFFIKVQENEKNLFDKKI